MKKIIFVGIFLIRLLAPQIIQAQGTGYLSNLGQSSIGSYPIGSDSWLATQFFTGTNAGGYTLNSIQIQVTNALGNPNGFTALLYASNPLAAIPGDSLGALSGSLNPATDGIYTFTPASNLTLSKTTYYYIVLTSETLVINGAYEWSYATANSYGPSGGWNSAGGNLIISNNGSTWSGFASDHIQYAINATAVPEPGILSLFGLGGFGFLWQRRKC